MSSNNTQTTSVQVGPGFLGLLTIVFVIAKLAGAITWSWWLVFSPMFVGLGLALILIVFVLLVAIFAD